MEFPTSGVSLSIGIQTGASCSWAVSGLPSWVTLSGASSGTGSATLTLVAGPNSGAVRSATIVIAGVGVPLTQPGALGCTYASSGGLAGAATGSIGVTTSPGCAWSAESLTSWITITGGSTGSGNGVVTFQVENPP